MAGKTIIMSKLKQIIRLREGGVALQTIAKAVDISRNTVKKYLRHTAKKMKRIFSSADKIFLTLRSYRLHISELTVAQNSHINFHFG